MKQKSTSRRTDGLHKNDTVKVQTPEGSCSPTKQSSDIFLSDHEQSQTQWRRHQLQYRLEVLRAVPSQEETILKTIKGKGSHLSAGIHSPCCWKSYLSNLSSIQHRDPPATRVIFEEHKRLDNNKSYLFLPIASDTMKFPAATFLVVILASLQTATAAKYDNCDVATYYSPVWDLYDAALLTDHLQTTHRDVIPYTSTAADCWDALIDLDANPSNANEVKLVYQDAYVPAYPYGESNTWKCVSITLLRSYSLEKLEK